MIQEPTSTKVLLVTPVWNDSKRLTVFGSSLARALTNSPLQIWWVIADDGSCDDEHLRLSELRESLSELFPRVALHFASEHHGKGSVIREAWEQAVDATWLAFVDADGSVNANDMLRLIEAAVSSDTSVIGIRKKTATTRVEESLWRGMFHRGFLVAVYIVLALRCEDPQCGAKVISGDAYRQVAGKLRENGYAFDSELLAALQRVGCEWDEIPVNWVEKGGGTVKPLRDAWAMLTALLRIRRRICTSA